MSDDLMRALAVNAAILQLCARKRLYPHERDVVVVDGVAPPWRGTVGDALDMADAALGVDAAPVPAAEWAGVKNR